MKRTTPPAWLPNWRYEKNYPTKLTLAEVRWQFLRRRADYQRDFARLPDGEPMQFLIKRTKQVSAITKEATAPLRTKYGRTYLLDPASDHAPDRYFPSPAAFGVHADHDQIERWCAMGYTLCRFDLASPLDPQLKALKAALSREAKAKGLAHRREPRYWIRHLRVLDAYAEGVTIEKIVSYLHDDEYAPPGKASKWHKAAREVQISLTGGSP